MPSRFHHYELRTTDMDAARAFYSDVVGPEIWGPDTSLAPIPERAAARGVPPHWLGRVANCDIEGTANRVASMGGERLGPALTANDGSSYAVVRDPFGAVLALGAGTEAPSRAPVVWHVLHSTAHERAFAFYSTLFGWRAGELLDLGPEVGRHRLFAWDDSGRSAGTLSDSALLRGVHPHWLFYFRVPDLEASLAKVRAHGGKVLSPFVTRTGDLIAACDDPQGGGFALYQFAENTR